MEIQDRIKQTREQLFKMQNEIVKVKSGMALMMTNDAPKLAIKKCIEMLNYLEGNVQEFDIPYDNLGEDDEDDEGEDSEEEEDGDFDEEEDLEELEE